MIIFFFKNFLSYPGTYIRPCLIREEFKIHNQNKKNWNVLMNMILQFVIFQQAHHICLSFVHPNKKFSVAVLIENICCMVFNIYLSKYYILGLRGLYI